MVPTQRTRPGEVDPDGPRLAMVRPRRIQILPRGSSGLQFESTQVGELQQTVVIGGVTLFVEDLDGVGLVDISTDRAVIWSRRVDGEKFVEKLRKNQDELMAKPGTVGVKFSVYVKDGKAALKATPVKDA